MKLLHWNIHMWRDATGMENWAAVRELLGQESPDVVSLVEVDEPAGDPRSLRRLADELGYTWLFAPAFEYRGVGGFGNALLVRGDIKAVQQWQLLSPRLYDGSEPSEQRIVVLASVTNADGTCWVGSTHLPRQLSTMRAEAADRLLAVLANLRAPWVVCGDFNQPVGSWLTAGLVAAPPQAEPTYPADRPAEAIDYCIASSMALNATVLPSSGSDHLPVIIEATPSNEECGACGADG